MAEVPDAELRALRLTAQFVSRYADDITRNAESAVSEQGWYERNPGSSALHRHDSLKREAALRRDFDTVIDALDAAGVPTDIEGARTPSPEPLTLATEPPGNL